MKRTLGVVGLALAVSAWAPVAHADNPTDTVVLTSGGRMSGSIIVDDPNGGITLQLKDGTVRKLKRKDVKSVERVNAEEVAVAPAPPPLPPPPLPVAPPLTRVVFEGSEAEVTLGPEHRCSAPCQMTVVPGSYQLTINDRPSHVIVVGNEAQTVRLRSGSPNMLIAGSIAIVAGIGLIAAGLSVNNNCTTPAAGSGYTYCLSIPLTLDATGALWGVAGIVVAILGGVQLSRTRLDTRPPESVAVNARPRVLPWATGTEGFHGGVGGLAVVF